MYPQPHSSLPVTTNTVETLYNVTPYNRIFKIRHKIAGNGSVSIKIPSLYIEYSLNDTDSNFWEQIYNFYWN